MQRGGAFKHRPFYFLNMIKKIICPTDFSETANNAIEYAAQLAKVFEAELLFINVQEIAPVMAAVSMGDGIGTEVIKSSRLAAGRLKEISAMAKNIYSISADYEVDVTTKSLPKILSSIGDDNAMIVMGTNGVDGMYQYFFGTNTYNVIKRANCPVLIVPEGITYKGVKKVVFAWDYSSRSKFSFTKLYDFMKAFKPKFVFFHVSKHHTQISRDVFRALRTEITAVLGENSNVSFEQIFSDNVPESINSYLTQSKADILSITFYNKGFVSDIFRGTVARELIETTKYPILVLHA